ncbi:unnamed protein product [Cyprideis torosa]|uniref:Uncharacterized protein n=1 Tax=Cyprideis torosa TaxID=163714 RepID=A0A7R8W4Z6_9CRUS|nr:unnamed protein product [Cyprideis torosa]CAG0884703.1 unnamed protein product [Cyprideis torosa]
MLLLLNWRVLVAWYNVGMLLLHFKIKQRKVPEASNDRVRCYVAQSCRILLSVLKRRRLLTPAPRSACPTPTPTSAPSRPISPSPQPPIVLCLGLRSLSFSALSPFSPKAPTPFLFSSSLHLGSLSVRLIAPHAPEPHAVFSAAQAPGTPFLQAAVQCTTFDFHDRSGLQAEDEGLQSVPLGIDLPLTSAFLPSPPQLPKVHPDPACHSEPAGHPPLVLLATLRPFDASISPPLFAFLEGALALSMQQAPRRRRPTAPHARLLPRQRVGGASLQGGAASTVDSAISEGKRRRLSIQEDELRRYSPVEGSVTSSGPPTQLSSSVIPLTLDDPIASEKNASFDASLRQLSPVLLTAVVQVKFSPCRFAFVVDTSKCADPAPSSLTLTTPEVLLKTANADSMEEDLLSLDLKALLQLNDEEEARGSFPWSIRVDGGRVEGASTVVGELGLRCTLALSPRTSPAPAFAMHLDVNPLALEITHQEVTAFYLLLTQASTSACLLSSLLSSAAPSRLRPSAPARESPSAATSVTEEESFEVDCGDAFPAPCAEPRVSLWIQVAAPRLALSVLSSSGSTEGWKLTLEMEGLQGSLDRQQVYTKTTFKLSSLGVKHFVKRSSNADVETGIGEGDVWIPGRFDGTVLAVINTIPTSSFARIKSFGIGPPAQSFRPHGAPASLPYPPLEVEVGAVPHPVLEATYTSALKTSVMEKWRSKAQPCSAPPSPSAGRGGRGTLEEAVGFLSEVDLRVQPMDLVLSGDWLRPLSRTFLEPLHHLQLGPQDPTPGETVHPPAPRIQLNSHPLLYASLARIRLILPASEHFLLLQVTSAECTSQVPNPLQRQVYDPDVLPPDGIPEGSPLVDRQYQMDVRGIMVLHGRASDFFPEGGSAVCSGLSARWGENPAFCWNTADGAGLPPDPLPPEVTLEAVLDSCSLRVQLAPGLFTQAAHGRPVAIAAHTLECHVTSDLELALSPVHAKTLFACLSELTPTPPEEAAGKESLPPPRQRESSVPWSTAKLESMLEAILSLVRPLDLLVTGNAISLVLPEETEASTPSPVSPSTLSLCLVQPHALAHLGPDSPGDPKRSGGPDKLELALFDVRILRHQMTCGSRRSWHSEPVLESLLIESKGRSSLPPSICSLSLTPISPCQGHWTLEVGRALQITLSPPLLEFFGRWMDSLVSGGGARDQPDLRQGEEDNQPRTVFGTGVVLPFKSATVRSSQISVALSSDRPGSSPHDALEVSLDSFQVNATVRPGATAHMVTHVLTAHLEGLMCGVLQPTGDLLQPTGNLLQPTGNLLQPTGDILQPTGDILQPTGDLRQRRLVPLLEPFSPSALVVCERPETTCDQQQSSSVLESLLKFPILSLKASISSIEAVQRILQSLRVPAPGRLGLPEATSPAPTPNVPWFGGLFRDHPQAPESDSGPQVHESKDDIRRGDFVFRSQQPTSSPSGKFPVFACLPSPQEILFDETKGTMTWCYPQPRTLVRILIHPVPLLWSASAASDADDIVSGSVQRFSFFEEQFVEVSSFQLSETTVQEVSLDHDPTAAKVWRIALFQGSSSSSSENRPGSVQMKISSRVLAGSVVVDSSFQSLQSHPIKVLLKGDLLRIGFSADTPGPEEEVELSPVGPKIPFKHDPSSALPPSLLLAQADLQSLRLSLERHPLCPSLEASIATTPSLHFVLPPFLSLRPVVPPFAAHLLLGYDAQAHALSVHVDLSKKAHVEVSPCLLRAVRLLANTGWRTAPMSALMYSWRNNTHLPLVVRQLVVGAGSGALSRNPEIRVAPGYQQFAPIWSPGKKDPRSAPVFQVSLSVDGQRAWSREVNLFAPSSSDAGQLVVRLPAPKSDRRLDLVLEVDHGRRTVQMSGALVLLNLCDSLPYVQLVLQDEGEATLPSSPRVPRTFLVDPDHPPAGRFALAADATDTGPFLLPEFRPGCLPSSRRLLAALPRSPVREGDKAWRQRVRVHLMEFSSNRVLVVVSPLFLVQSLLPSAAEGFLTTSLATADAGLPTEADGTPHRHRNAVIEPFTLPGNGQIKAIDSETPVLDCTQMLSFIAGDDHSSPAVPLSPGMIEQVGQRSLEGEGPSTKTLQQVVLSLCDGGPADAEDNLLGLTEPQAEGASEFTQRSTIKPGTNVQVRVKGLGSTPS